MKSNTGTKVVSAAEVYRTCTAEKNSAADGRSKVVSAAEGSTIVGAAELYRTGTAEKTEKPIKAQK